MSFLQRILKTIVFAFLLLFFVIVSSIGSLLLRDPLEKRRFLLEFLHRMCKVLLVVMAVRVKVEGTEHLRVGQNYLLVANHMSYLDPLILSALTPTAFVTSVEMRDAFFLGTFTKLAGCFYVERRSKGNIHREVEEVEQALRDGFSVAIYPEATSTDGSRILPFKRPLFAAAVRAERSVLPMVIQYESINGVRISRTSHAELCWYGDMPFFSHSLHLLSLRRIRIRLRILPEIPVAATSDRDTIAETARGAIVNQYEPIS